MSAYDLARAVKMHGALYRTFSRGNLYAQLAQYEQAGYTGAQRIAAARGPSKTKIVYELTAAGVQRFETLLKSALADVQATDDTVEVACVLLGQLPRDHARSILSDRLQRITDQEKRLERLRGSPDQRSAAAELSMMHAVSRLRAEAAWLRESIALLRKANWKPEWGNDVRTPR